MKSIFLMAGTSEGRLLAEQLVKLPLRVSVSVATAYGASLLPVAENLRIFVGKRDAHALAILLREQQADFAIDATHPYAKAASEQLRKACAAAGASYRRVGREVSAVPAPDAICVASPEEAADFLRGQGGAVLLTTGSNALAVFAPDHAKTSRYFARVLPLTQVLEKCAALGFTGRHVIAMQGPFSRAFNAALLRETGASWLVTKESGDAGGFAEKLAAAKDTGAGVLIITRPPEPGETTCVQALLEELRSECNKEKSGGTDGFAEKREAAKSTSSEKVGIPRPPEPGETICVQAPPGDLRNKCGKEDACD